MRKAEYFNKRMRTYSTILFLTILFLVAGVEPARAQWMGSTPTQIFVDAGAGIGAGPGFAASLAGEARLQRRYEFLTLHAAYMEELQIYLFPDAHPPFPEHIFTASVLYGRSTLFHLPRMIFPFPFALIINREIDYSIAASIGVSGSWNRFVGNIIEDDVDWGWRARFAEERTFVVGIPIHLEIVEYITPSVGYVHRLYVNLNRKQSSWGMLWGLQVNVTP